MCENATRAWMLGRGPLRRVPRLGRLRVLGVLCAIGVFAVPAWAGQEGVMLLVSTVFAEGAAIPARYTCDGDDVSPPLAWEGAPAGTRGYALVCDDPDAPVGVWDHWILFNIPAAATGLPEAMPADPIQPLGTVAQKAAHGLNSWRRTGYGGPCPPSGTHRYYFTLYALDTVLPLKAGVRKADLVRAMEGHILAQARLMGRYARR